MSVTQLSDFENKNICYEEPIRKNREIRVGIVDSNEDTLYVQLPEMRLEKINYVDDSSERGLIDTIVLKIIEAESKSSKSIYKKLKSIETTSIQSMAKRSEEWFGKSLKKESIQNMFEHCLCENGEGGYCFKLHVSQTKQLPDSEGIVNDLEVYNQKGKARSIANLKIGEKIQLIVKLKDIRIVSKSASLTWVCTHAQIFEKKQKLKGYLFARKNNSEDLSDEEEIYEDIIESFVQKESSTPEEK